MNFTPKRVGETEVFTVDFASILPAGATITSAAWSVRLVAGVDADPNAMLSGSATVSGTKVSQMLTGGIAGVTYAPICTVQTSDDETMVLPDPGAGFLRVVP